MLAYINYTTKEGVEKPLNVLCRIGKYGVALCKCKNQGNQSQNHHLAQEESAIKGKPHLLEDLLNGKTVYL